MKTVFLSCLFAFSAIFFFTGESISQPNVQQFKQAFEKHLQQLKPDYAAKRTIKYGDVVALKPDGQYYSFKVTAYIHDYAAGYPANHYYGKTCVGKMDAWKFDMFKNEQGEWTVQGRFTVSGDDLTCKDNTAAGMESIPLASVPGAIYDAGNAPAQAAPDRKPVSSLYIGQYAGYGSGGQLLIGMGFTLLNNGTYYDLDKKNGGSYLYNAQQATISFKGGFLNSQTGKNVKPTGFDLGNVHCEPWR